MRFLNIRQFFQLFIIFLSAISVVVIILLLILSEKDFDVFPKDGQYLIDGTYCKVPLIELTITKPRNVLKVKPQCSKKKLLTSVIITTKGNETMKMKVHEEYLSIYKVPSVKCKYRIIERDTERDVDNDFRLTKPSEEFDNELELGPNTQNAYAECYSGDPSNVIYRTVHAVINVRDEFKERFRETGLKKRKYYRVLMFGIDSISRNHLEENMKFTKKFLKGSKYYEFRGFTRSGHDKFANMLSILSGYTTENAPPECLPGSKQYFDSCPLIWNDFKDAGFVTAYGEDQTNISTFNLNGKGFKNPPTDHYMRPFMLAAEQFMEVSKWNNMTFCIGDSLVMDHLAFYATKLITLHKYDPYFGLFWFNMLNDPDLSTAPIIEKRIAAYLTKMGGKNLLDDAFVILFSNRGLRFQPDFMGFLDERFPLMYMKLPKGFEEKFPDYVKNLEINRDRFTTPMDLHVTLKHILQLSGHDISVSAPSCWSCKSLFEEIPLGRTCEDVNIGDDSCPCNVQSINPKMKVIEQVARFAVERINEMYPGAHCGPFIVNHINSVHLQKKFYHVDYILNFNVSFSKANFEAHLKRKAFSFMEPNFELIGPITQLNAEVNASNICENDEREEHVKSIEEQEIAEDVGDD